MGGSGWVINRAPVVPLVYMRTAVSLLVAGTGGTTALAPSAQRDSMSDTWRGRGRKGEKAHDVRRVWAGG